MTTNTLEAVAVTLASDIKAFRSAAVTAENKATPFARSLLAGLVSGSTTQALAVSAVILAFGNPKSPKSNKPVEKLSGLRDFTGGDAVRKTAETAFDVFANIGVGDAIRPLIVSFILETDGAPKSLRALNDGVKSLLREEAKRQADAAGVDNADAVADNEQALADAAPIAPAVSLVDRINAVTVALADATDDAMNDAYPAMEALIAAYDARINAATDAAPVAIAA